MGPPAYGGSANRPEPSPANSNVFVTSSPDRSGLPVRGSVTPFKAGWFFTQSGVSPFGIIQTWSPVLRSIAVILPHGGLISGNLRGPSGPYGKPGQPSATGVPRGSPPLPAR